MNINGVSSLLLPNTNLEPAGKAGETAPAGLSFADYLKNALNEVQDLQKVSDVATQKLATGEIDDIHSVMIAAEKANLSLQLTIQIRNKMVEAYQEIMRMQL